jgi:hypothetical protein
MFKIPSKYPQMPEIQEVHGESRRSAGIQEVRMGSADYCEESRRSAGSTDYREKSRRSVWGLQDLQTTSRTLLASLLHLATP